MTYEPLLGLIFNYLLEQNIERSKLKCLFDIVTVHILNEGGASREERVISMASHELGYEEAETQKLIQYLEVLY